MSELIDSGRKRKDLLKHLILQLHEGVAPDAVKQQLTRLLGQVPYGDVVEVEQELIAEGLPQEEVLKLCDVHSAALKGSIDQQGAKQAPPGHPIHTLQQENLAIGWETKAVRDIFSTVEQQRLRQERAGEFANQLLTRFNALTDSEKHYVKKENQLFPFLEKHGITGPSQVMWGKHDEVRAFLKNSLKALHECHDSTIEELQALIALVLRKTVDAIDEMVFKEEEILFPMSLDTLSDEEFFDISLHSDEIGYCLFDPTAEWKPALQQAETSQSSSSDEGSIKLTSGSFTAAELTSILNTLPLDITFVDRHDRVRYFSQGKERIFERNRAILGREVQHCHPPKSVHIVQKILDDFRSGQKDQASFWITMQGKFIHISYYALRDDDGTYLGTLEASQDLTEKRNLSGEQRLLAYATTNDNEGEPHDK